MGLGIDQLADGVSAVVGDGIRSEVEHFEVLADANAFNERVDDLFFVDVIFLQIKFLKPALRMPDQLHESIAQLANRVVRNVQRVDFMTQCLD